MTAATESTKRKLALPQLAKELGNVSEACQITGSRLDTFYEVRRTSQVGGVGALMEQHRGPNGAHPNRVAPQIEEKILAFSLEHPTGGDQRVSNELRVQVANVNPSGVRCVWLRHDLETRYKCPMRVETHGQDETVVLVTSRFACSSATPTSFRCAT